MASLNLLDRVLLQLAPRRAADRIRARVLAESLLRHYEAAQGGYRTEHWKKVASDANAANAASLHTLRNIARDLVRNNTWAKRGKQVIANNTVGWGLVPTPVRAGTRAQVRARRLWQRHFETTACDVAGQLNVYGMQRLAIETIVESGEVLVRRYWRSTRERLTLPLQLQVLEPDHLDTTRDGVPTEGGGRIVQGVEYDADGRRVAYWLFRVHPGASYQLGTSWLIGQSQRVPAADVIHAYKIERPGQVRGPSWYAPVIVRLKDYDEYEDATLFKQKIAACLTAFVTDVDGSGLPAGEQSAIAPLARTLSPGLVQYLPVGKEVKFVAPPQVPDGTFDVRQLRAAAAGLGVTYEDISGDYSHVNFSSARMARLAHWANVYDWQWNMLVPTLCDRIWAWAMEAALVAGEVPETPAADWTAQPMPVIEPDREARADIARIRGGQATFSQVLRERGLDPETHFDEYAADLARLDALKITLDSDPRKTTQAGNAAQTGGAAAPPSAENE